MAGTTSSELRDYIRGAAGGLVVGLPLLYTMEVWLQGFTLAPIRIVILLIVAFLLVIAFNLIAGFRRERTLVDVLIDSVQALGIALVIAAFTLLLLGQLDGASLSAGAGKVALEAIPVAFGVSLARTQLAADEKKGSTGRAARSGTSRVGSRRRSQPRGAGDVERYDKPGGERVGPFGQLTLTAAGALIFALNVAPTEEIVVIAGAADGWLLVAIVLASLIMTLALVFWSNFPAGQRIDPESPLDSPYGETVAAYAVSLAVSFLLLWSFGRTSGTSLEAIISMAVVLGFVASLGGAIGRLLVGGGSERGTAGGHP